MITNGYATLAEAKAYLKITSVDATDDTVLESLVEHSSRLIDAETRRTFYARTETHYYDVPSGGSLYIDDDDLLTVTSLTNGDGVAIVAASYKLYPLNSSPKWEIRLLPSSNVYWAWSTAGDISAAITLVGTWGYAATAPADIHGAWPVDRSSLRAGFNHGLE